MRDERVPLTAMLSLDGSATEDPPAGQRYGPYEVVRTLGAGGFGVVFEARHAFTGARVALKVLHAQHYQNASVRERFLREARAAAEVRHPHVVEVYEVGEVEGTACIAMRYLEGPSLADQLERHGPMDVADALDVMIPVLSAVQAAHDVGIIHRDLKPDNVVLARIDDRLHPMLLDFGIAKLTADGPSMTQTNMVFGTPHYMSPEQARDTKSASAQSDLWSLGVMVFECLTGTVPWPGDSLVDVQLRIMEQGEVSARTSVPGLAVGLDEAIQVALRRDPKARYASVRAFAQALLPFARASTRAAWSAAFSSPVTEPEAITPRLVAPTAVATSVVVAPEAPPAEPRPRGGLRWVVGALALVAVVAASLMIFGVTGARSALPPPPIEPRAAVRTAPPPRPPPVAPAPVRVAPAAPAALTAPPPPQAIAPPAAPPPRVRRAHDGAPRPHRRPQTGVPIL